MSARLHITRAGPLATVQDQGRHGHFQEGISASGPMDAGAFGAAGDMLGTTATSGIEITTAGLDFVIAEGSVSTSFVGGNFALSINSKAQDWGRVYQLKANDSVEIRPGSSGNYGYIRFNAEIDVPKVLGSRSTNLVAGLGGWKGRALVAGDVLNLLSTDQCPVRALKEAPANPESPVRFIWGIHADQFGPEMRNRLNTETFHISTRMNRMGVTLVDDQKIFANARILSLVSDPVVSGDIQILGDGTPIVLMRDHQPTGGYPRIGTVISADLDRFAQMRPGTKVRFASVSVERAQSLSRT